MLGNWSDFSASGHSGKCMSIAQSWSDNHDIRSMALPFETPRLLAYPSKSGIGFITNHNTLFALEVLNYALVKSFRSNVSASSSLHRFQDKRSRLIIWCRSDNILDISDRISYVSNRQAKPHAIQSIHMRRVPWSNIGNSPCVSHKSVVSMPEAINVLLFSEHPWNHHWKVNRLTCRVAQIDIVESWAKLVQ